MIVFAVFIIHSVIEKKNMNFMFKCNKKEDSFDIKKAIVIGCPGSGKTTFSEKLS